MWVGFVASWVSAVFAGCDIATRGRPDLSIIAPDRCAARMPGTGPLRRSSAPVWIKAIVDKSRIGAGALRSPRSVFPAVARIGFTLEFGSGFLDDLGGKKSFAKLDGKLRGCLFPSQRRIFPFLGDIA